MSKETFYLRMEGVNLDSFVFDTKDLSTVRGGSLLLLEAVDLVEEKLKEQCPEGNVVAISTGASSGLFKFEAERESRAYEIRDAIESALNRDEQLKHATFMVDVLPARGEENFAEDREQLIARNRWRQMSSPCLAVPSRVSGCKDACATDLIRPEAAESNRRNKEGKKVSESVWQRRQYGIESKRGKLYQRLTGLPETVKFAEDLGKLTDDSSRENLHHKMAVVYVDGNSFGKLHADFSKSRLSEFDREIKGKRKAFLGKLVERMEVDPSGWKTTTGGACRLETLLWGGDEFMLVVPAWKGWETLQLFYQESKNWEFDGKPLTHSAGLVFCHHNAPIHRIKALAHDLAEVCKDKRVVGEKDNYFACQVLESFDHISGNVADYLKKMSVDNNLRSMVLAGKDMGKIADGFAKFKADEAFARGRLHGIVKAHRNGKEDEAKNEAKKLMAAVAGETNHILNSLTGLLNGDAHRWLHICDLWDYVGLAKGGAANG